LGLAGYLQGAVGAVFLLAAAAKLIRYGSLLPFLLAVGFSRDISERVSRAVPPLEGLLGALLILGVALPAAASATALALAFTFFLVLAKTRGVTESCRCFGFLEPSRLSFLPVARAAVLALGALVLSFAHLQTGSFLWVNPWGSSSITATILGVLTGIGYVAAFSLMEQTRSFERRRPRRVPSVRNEAP
jgi:hypothetical protein